MNYESLISGLTLASVSGMTYLAYKHPKAYGVIWRKLSNIVLIAFFLALAWDTSRSHAYRDIRDAFPIDKRIEMEALFSGARRAVEDGEILSWRVVLLYLAAVGYFSLLLFLPYLLSKDKPVNPERDEERL